MGTAPLAASSLATEAAPPEPRDWIYLVLVLVAALAPWGVLFAALAPAEQNFPLNDDWAFGKGAIQFASGEGIHYQGWASMPLLGQWLWAWPFLKVLGASNVALRLSTIVLSWMALAAFYDLIRQQGVYHRIAALTTAVLASCPYFMMLSATFMTDVPALAFSLVALACYGRAVSSGRPALLAPALAAALLGAVTRQNTIAVPVTAWLLMLGNPRTRWRLGWWAAAILPAAVCIGFHFWLLQREDTIPRSLEWPSRYMLGVFPFIALHFLGLLALPLMPLLPLRRVAIIYGAALASMLAVAFYFFRTTRLLFPYLLIWLPEAFVSTTYNSPPLYGNNWLRFDLTILGCLGGAALVAALAQLIRARTRPGPLLLFAGLQIPILIASSTLYDRYLFPLIPGALALLAVAAPAQERWKGLKGLEQAILLGLACAALWIFNPHLILVLAGVLALIAAASGAPANLPWRQGAVLGLTLLYGIAATGVVHDWLETNSAVWAVGRRAVADLHLRPTDIDGGLEWDGWHCPGLARPWLDVNMNGPPLLHPMNGACFPYLTGRFAIGFNVPPGARPLIVQSYRLWLAPGQRQTYLLEWRP